MSDPVTPAQAALPGNGQPQEPNQAATPPAQQPVQPAATVTLDPKEHAQLLRDQARLRSLQRRGQRQPAAATQDDPADPNDEVVKAQNRNRELEHQLFTRDVKDGVRELLDKPEYAALPESTRKLILKAPHTLSESKDQETVLADIEEFLSEEAAALKAQPSRQQVQAPHQPQGHDTPPKVSTGSPAALPTAGLEDVSGLTGSARSRAIFRNLQKKQKGIKE